MFIRFFGFCMGFCIYGAIGLIGTIVVEVAPIHMTGTAHAIVGLSANSKFSALIYCTVFHCLCISII